MRKYACLVTLAISLLGSQLALAQEASSETSASNRRESTMNVMAQAAVLDVNEIPGPALGAGAAAEYQLMRGVFAGANISYWRGKNEDASPDVDVSDLIVGAHAKTVFTRLARLALPLRPFLQAGLDMHRLTIETNKTDDTRTLANDARKFETRLGVNGGVGSLFAINDNLDASVGLLYRHIFGNPEVRYNQLAFAGGVAYRL